MKKTILTVMIASIVFSCAAPEKEKSESIEKEEAASSLVETTAANADQTFNEFDDFNAITASETENALIHIRWAWNNPGPCTRTLLCATYIDHAGISFSDGNFGVFVRVQRLTTSAHDCIQKAKNALREGNKALAVEWVMASQIHNRPVYDWLRGHGDAVVSALNACC